MLLSDLSPKVMLYREACDMRKSIDGLTPAVSEILQANPTDGTVYVFINKGRDKIKLLYWDRNGFCIWYKRLEKEKFILPKVLEKTPALTREQLSWLIDGLDISKIKGFERLKYDRFY
jgi:transposase